ncbi:MAG: toll/interleukin-1 receptor domain-containing protein [Candidatus Thiodiazotropha endolucinida]
MMQEARKLIFISHANPEDNEFTLWLASRLTAMGYLVWSDVTQLFGAEKFWRDIEDAIRNHSAKVIVVLSRVSQTKDGVLNEIHTALAVEKKTGADRFVVPIRIDDLPSTDITSVLIQKGYIDFYRNWADGFSKLLSLLDKENVSRGQSQAARETSQWIDRLLAGSERVVQEPQTIVSNWFRFDSLPENLNFYRVPVPEDQIRSRFEAFTYPVYPYRDMIATFASEEDITKFLPFGHIASRAYQIPVHAILHNESHSLPTLEWQDSSRMLSYLIRTAWDNIMREKGLHPYMMANSRQAWYLTDGYSADGWARYADMYGVSRRRRLVGKSGKRNVYWHFAMESLPSISRESHLVLKPHVVFTEDGKAPLASDKRMHSLRRSFCRNWWNARWRDLMLAYTSTITEEMQSIEIPVGTDQMIMVSPRPITFDLSVSLFSDDHYTTGEDETDAQLDEIAEDSDEFCDEVMEEESPSVEHEDIS